MSAKRPQTDHGKALSAFLRGWISNDEYKACWRREAFVSGRTLVSFRSWSFGRKRLFAGRAKGGAK